MALSNSTVLCFRKGSCHSFQQLLGSSRKPAQRLQQEISTTTAAANKPKSISGIMGAYKTTTSKLIRQAGLPEFTWQRSFYDHIIRSSADYKQIAAYILDNPSRWPEDKFYT